MNMNLIPTADQPRAIIGLLRQSGAIVADDAIQNIADTHGDAKAKELIKKLPALVVAQIVGEFDYTKTGVVAQLLTPKGVKEAVERLPLTGGGSVCTFLCATILNRDEKERGEYFRALGSSELSLLALASAFNPETVIQFNGTGCFEVDGEKATEYNLHMGEGQDLLFWLKRTARSTYYKVVEKVKTAQAYRPALDLTAEFRAMAQKASAKTSEADPYATE